VTIEIERASRVLRVPNAATRVRPSPDVFAALGQPLPDESALPEEWTHDEEPVSDTLGIAAAGRPAEVWTLRSGRLEPIAVRLGTTDAIHAAVLAGELAEGVEVVTAIHSPATSTPNSSSSPLLPSRRPPPAGRGIGGPGGP
jgi:hypothetical protein